MTIFSFPIWFSNLKCLGPISIELICFHTFWHCSTLYSDSSNRYGYSSNTFIFSLINKEGLAPFKSMVKSPKQAIYKHEGCGPTFGGGHDIYISNNANSNTTSHTNFHKAYYHIPSRVQNRLTILAGSYKFKPDEVEVFYLIWVAWHREQKISDGIDSFFFLPRKWFVI